MAKADERASEHTIILFNRPLCLRRRREDLGLRAMRAQSREEEICHGAWEKDPSVSRTPKAIGPLGLLAALSVTHRQYSLCER